MFSTPYSDGAKKTLCGRIEDNKYIIDEFFCDYRGCKTVNDHQDAKIDYYEMTIAINEVTLILGGKYLRTLKSDLFSVHNIFDDAFSFNNVEFGLQDIRYLNARGYVGLLIKDSSGSIWFRKASDVFNREICKNDEIEWPSGVNANRNDFLSLWAAELLRCLLRKEYLEVINRFSDIENRLSISNKQSVESNILFFCNSIASKDNRFLENQRSKLFSLVNEFWCKCLSNKEYWGFPSFFIYLIRYIYIREVIGLEPALNDIFPDMVTV
jgi:hypothetical protein